MVKPLTEGRVNKGGRNSPPKTSRPSTRPQGESVLARVAELEAGNERLADMLTKVEEERDEYKRQMELASLEVGRYEIAADEWESERDEARARVEELEAECARLRQRTEEGCHWACLDAEDDMGLPMARSHHSDCMKERCRRSEQMHAEALRELDKEERRRKNAEARVAELEAEVEREREEKIEAWISRDEALAECARLWNDINFVDSQSSHPERLTMPPCDVCGKPSVHVQASLEHGFYARCKDHDSG
jgi:chromosome segregation ATPase